jgi:hypothetical protein
LSKWEDIRHSEAVRAYINTIPRSTNTHEISTKLVELSRCLPPAESLLSELGFLPKTSKEIERLDNLMKRKFIPLKNLVELDQVEIDESAYSKSLFLLTSARPTLTKNNQLDALNFALTYALNDTFFQEKRLYFLYITHGAPYYSLSSVLWDTDPMRDEDTSLGFGIVRDLMYASHDTLADLWFPKLSSKTQFISEALRHCSIRTYELETLRRNIERGQGLIFDLADVLSERPSDAYRIVTFPPKTATPRLRVSRL